MDELKGKKYSIARGASKHGVLGIIFGVLLLALGILLLIAPLASVSVLIWAVIALLGIGAIVAIVKFIFPGDGERDGLLLALAIIVLLCIAGLIVAACLFPDQIIDGTKVSGFAFFTGRLLVFFAVFFGVVIVVNGIYNLCTIGTVKSGKGWVIAYAIISIICGVLMTIFPFFWTVVGAIIAAIYAIAGGIAIIVIACKGLSVSHKEKKAAEDKNKDVVDVKDAE